MDTYVVNMLDGGGIWHTFYTEAPDKDTAYEKVIDSFAIYGKPYGIEKDGCKYCEVCKYEKRSDL